ncbi:uncharacterized protein LOC124290698 isoform X2 [Haliotis rubra]|uniref:uncharacterized protein LOC124290698 isoform X2 n=1 Tax=Haliotis rubra TaxID=36100 RepID=UPI001EE53410|nr:uncharacterized protein LOC124290698 isoform X2 [Haliotis rubra]
MSGTAVHRLLPVFNDQRITQQKPVLGIDFHDDREMAPSPIMQDYMSDNMPEAESKRLIFEPELHPTVPQVKDRSENAGERDRFRRRDPRHVAVSWYSYYYSRPDSPTQWQQHTEEPQGQAMIDADISGRVSPSNQTEMTAEIPLLHKLSALAETGHVIKTSDLDLDLEVEDIFNEEHHLIRPFKMDPAVGKWGEMDIETRALLSRLRRSSPPVDL